MDRVQVRRAVFALIELPKSPPPARPAALPLHLLSEIHAPAADTPVAQLSRRRVDHQAWISDRDHGIWPS